MEGRRRRHLAETSPKAQLIPVFFERAARSHRWRSSEASTSAGRSSRAGNGRHKGPRRSGGVGASRRWCRVLTAARSIPETASDGVHFVAADLSTADGCSAVATAVTEQLGGIDIIVNVSAVGAPGGCRASLSMVKGVGSEPDGGRSIDRALLPAMIEQDRALSSTSPQSSANCRYQNPRPPMRLQRRRFRPTARACRKRSRPRAFVWCVYHLGGSRLRRR